MADDEVERVADLLVRFFDKEYGAEANAAVHGIRRTSDGLSRENWVFDLTAGRTKQELILRRDPEAVLLDTDRAVERDLLAALGPAPIPSPVVLWSDVQGIEFERPSLIMRRERGVCDYMVLNGELPLDDRKALAERFCDLLVSLHALDLDETGIRKVLDDPGEEAALTALEEWTSTLRGRVGAPYPELEAAALWLADRAPSCNRLVLVHGDFKAGNMLLEDQHVTALLDWETAHIGDPHEDLGWVTQPLRKREHQIPGAWETEDILRHYTRVSGWEVDRDAVAWWRLFASYKSAVIQLTGLQEYVDGRSDRLFREPTSHMRELVNAMSTARSTA